MSKGQIIGLIGSVLLIIGVFIPLVRVPLAGGISFFDSDKLESIILIVLAVISIFLIVLKMYKLVWFSGIAALATVSASGIQTVRKLLSIKSTAEKIIGEKLTDKFTNATVEQIHISWGLVFMFVGAILIMVCMAFDKNKKEITGKTIAN
jgi:hypothetical protein